MVTVGNFAWQLLYYTGSLHPNRNCPNSLQSRVPAPANTVPRRIRRECQYGPVRCHREVYQCERSFTESLFYNHFMVLIFMWANRSPCCCCMEICLLNQSAQMRNAHLIWQSDDLQWQIQQREGEEWGGGHCVLQVGPRGSSQGSALSFLAGCLKSHFLAWYRKFFVYWYLKLDNHVVNSTCPKGKLGWIWRADDP